MEVGIQASLVNEIVKQVGSLLSFRDADPRCLRDALFILEDSTEAWIKTGLLGDIEAYPYFLNQSFVRLNICDGSPLDGSLVAGRSCHGDLSSKARCS